LNHTLHGSRYEPQKEKEGRTPPRPKLSKYNSKSEIFSSSEIVPLRVTLIRHGEAEGNVDSDLFQTKPDSTMSLTELGWVQARMAGEALREQITRLDGENSLHFIVSPYVRTMETFHGIASAWCDPEEVFGHIQDRNARLTAWYNRLAEEGLSWHEDPRIREQDFGNYQVRNCSNNFLFVLVCFIKMGSSTFPIKSLFPIDSAPKGRRCNKKGQD